ncbi:MAG: hypothetical protein ACK55Z_28650, partial [bacterium]
PLKKARPFSSLVILMRVKLHLQIRANHRCIHPGQCQSDSLGAIYKDVEDSSRIFQVKNET